MSDAMQPREPARRANPAPLEGDIDAGATGDKTPGFDPAAAPLGADEEAAGPMVSERREEAQRKAERAGRPEVKHPNAATPELAPDASPPRQVGNLVTGALIGVAAALILAAILYLAL